MGMTFESTVIEFEKVVHTLAVEPDNTAAKYRAGTLRTHGHMLIDARGRGRYVETFTPELAARFHTSAERLIAWVQK